MSQNILITGTNSGFGYLMAKGAAEKGLKVYAAMRNTTSKNKERAEELSQLENIEVVEIDVTSDEQVNTAISQIVEKDGKLDILVNNAGYFGGGLAETYEVQDLENMFNTNVKGPWRTMKAALPSMRKQNAGLIINITSSLGRFSAPFMTVYNGTKFALEGLSEGLHYEVRQLGVDVALIQPGAFPTELFGKTALGSDQSVVEGYGDIAKIPESIGEGMGQMFEQMDINPQMVADAVFKLIDTPQGQRPLRTSVDVQTGEFVVKANEQIAEGYKGFLGAFGMGELLT